ncbi:transposon TX1 protein [Scenedesmus sp. PABB004]|nr:transposon TX1 protein [Scenedesmus sp. PABB004]
MPGGGLKVVAVNVNGLNRKPSRQAFFAWLLASRYHVVVLTETHAQGDGQARRWVQGGAGPGRPWQGSAWWSHGSSASRGVGILIRDGVVPAGEAPSIEYCDTVGRLLRVGWRTQHGDRLSVLGVYAPSERAERPAFFAGPYQEALLAGPAGALLLAGGDFNCVVSPADVQPLPGQAAARSGRCHGGADLARANAAAGVVDALLRVAPQLRAQPTHYQRRDGAVHGGRIDAWFVAQELADHWLVGAAHHPLCHSDHRPVSVSLQRPGQPLAGRRRWTFPNDLLACASRRAELRDRVAAAAQQLRDAGLDPGELFEQLKQSVRRIAAELRAEMRQQEQQELRQLRHALRAARWAAGSQQYGCPEAAANALAAERTLAAAEAAQRRQQADALEAVWDECGEGPSRWFHRLGRAPGGAQPIHALARPGQPAVPLTSRAGIQEGGRIIADFFDADVPGGMFGVRPTDQQQQDCMLDALDRQLSAAEQRACRGQDPEGLLTFAEATAALASLPRGAAPGSDGLTCEAYAALWEVLGEPLVQAFNYHYLNQAAGAPQLAATQRLGLITLIHKGGQPREAVSSYRPITLLNTDTKIAAKAIVQRLAPALGSIVDGTQTAFVPGRDIADNVLMHLEAIDHARETRAPGCLLFLDFAKAYDRLDRGWLFRCLARMGLPDATTRWVRLLLAGTRARVAFNGGHVSREFSVASGCAQGSPLSPLLYVLAAQPLAAMCRRVQRQPGFASLQLPGGAGPAPCCHQHADDTTLHAASVESAKRLLDGAVAPFCLASGAQLNLAKCKGMLLGDHPALQLQPDGSGQLVECNTGVCFPDTEQAPIRHLGVLLSATGVERHAAQLYRERLRTITCRIAHWSRYALTRPGRRHVARQVLAACVGWHAQFVPVPADLLRLIQRRVTAYIVGNWCIRESDNRIIRQVPRAAIACLPASMGGEAQVDVAAFTTAMLAKTAARLLHPVGAAWKPPAAARFARALPGRGTAALVQGTALELRAQLPWRWGAIACAFAALGVHRVIPHGSMTVEQIRVEALVGNCSVGAALGGARIASLEDLPAELRSDSLGQAAPRLPWRPAADGVVMPGEWQQALARSGPSAPGWQALRPSAAPPSPGGGVVQQPQQPLAALPVEQPPQPPPPPPAVRWVRRWALGAAAASFFEVGPDSRLRTAEPPPEIVAAGGWEDCCVVDAAQAPRPAAGAQRAAAGAPGAAAPAEQPEMHSRARRWFLVGFWPDVRVDPSVWGLGHAATVMQFTVRGATLRLLQLRCAREVTPAGGWTPGVGCVPGLWRAGYGQACPASAIARREAGQKRSWAERQRAATPDPEPGLPAWQKVSPPRRHVMERVGPAAAAAAAARREEQERRREQQLEQRRTLVREPAANDLVDPLTGATAPPRAGERAEPPAWAACYARAQQARMPRALRHFGWSLLHGGVRVSGDRVFSYQRAAPELAELACPHPLCRAQQQPPLETLGHVLGGCPVAAAVLQWFAHLWARLQPGFPSAPPPPRVMLADDFARSGVAPELQQLWTHLRLLLLRALLAARARHGGGRPGHAPVAAIRIFVYSDHRDAGTEAAAAGVRATAATPGSPAVRPCGPGVGGPLYVCVGGAWRTITSDKLGVGPSAAGPAPGPDYAWVEGAWRRAAALPTPAGPPERRAGGARLPGSTGRARAAPTAAPAHAPPATAARRRTTGHAQGRPAAVAQRAAPPCALGLSALVFGVGPEDAIDGGNPARSKISEAVRRAIAAGADADTLTLAAAALAAGRMQWMGSTRAAQRRRVMRVRLQRIPSAHRAALLQHRAALAAALRAQLGWRLVVCEDGRALPAQPPLPTDANPYAALADAAAAEAAPDSGAECRAAPPRLHGSIVCKHFAGHGDFYGVVLKIRGARGPYAYRVHYTDGEDETMTEEEARGHLAGSVPAAHAVHALRARLLPPTPADGVVVKRYFRSHRQHFYGVLTIRPPFFAVAYTDGDAEDMDADEAARHAVADAPELAPHWAGLAARGARADLYPLAAAAAAQLALGADAPEAAPAAAAAAPAAGAAAADVSLAPERVPAADNAARARRACPAYTDRRMRRRHTGLVRAANLAWARAGLRVACINVCGMTRLKAAELAAATTALCIDILAVVETWEGHPCVAHELPGYTFIGKPRSRGQGGGVGFYVARALAPLVRAPADTQLPEALWLELRRGGSAATARPASVGVVYLPPASLESAALRADTYAQLQTDIQRFQERGAVLVLGDFNSRVGSSAPAEQQADQPPARIGHRGPAPCALTVADDRRITKSDHLLLWTCLPHPAARARAPAGLRRRVARTDLLKPVPGQRDAGHADAYRAELADALADYADDVAALADQVGSALLPAREACARAKAALCDAIWTAVDGSVGYREAAAELAAARDQLCAAQRAVKSAVAAARAAELGRRVDAVHARHAAGDGKGMWEQLRQIAGTARRGPGGPAALRAAASTGMVVGEQQIANALAAQYASVSDPAAFAAGADFDEQWREQVEADVARYRAAASDPSGSDSEQDPLSADITAAEVAAQAQALSNNKAPSPLDGVTNELLKYGGEPLWGALAAFFNLQFTLETKAQTAGVITPIYKRGDPTDPANYRPITLGSAVDKLYNLVLNKRLTDHLEGHGLLHDAQQGFRPGRSAADNIFMLTSCLDARAAQGLDTYVLFLDVAKAYDTVWRSGLLHNLWRVGVRGRLFRVLANMTDRTRSMVRHRGALSTAFEPGLGWEQGDTLATTMFNVFINAVLQEVWAACPGVPLPAAPAPAPAAPPAPPAGAAPPAPEPGAADDKLVALLFADDCASLAAGPAEMQQLLGATRAALARWRLKASVSSADASKTAVMVVPGGRTRHAVAAAAAAAAAYQWSWGAEQVPRVTGYRYLGAWLTADRSARSWDAHLQRRKAAADKAFWAQSAVLRERRLPLRLRLLTLTGVVQPVLTHAAQVWARPTVERRAELDSWQAGLVARMTGCPPNVSHACLQQELGITPLHVVCDTLMLRYWHRLRALPADRLLRRVADAWPATPWWKGVGGLLRDYGVDVVATAGMSRNEFAAHLCDLAGDHIDGAWEAAAGRGSVARRYREAFGSGVFSTRSFTRRAGVPCARDYLGWLCSPGGPRRGRPAALLMRLRMEISLLFTLWQIM